MPISLFVFWAIVLISFGINVGKEENRTNNMIAAITIFAILGWLTWDVLHLCK